MGKAPLIVIVGPTASGKSALAIELAKLINHAAVSRIESVSVRGRESQASRTNGTVQRDSQGRKQKMANKPAELGALHLSRLAGLEGAEIVCADSRTVYKHLDIGTAKPSAKNRQKLPHHLLDVVEADEPFTVADFKRLAEAAIKDIISRGKLPILVGGSGLYIDALLYDFEFAGPEAPRDQQNPRHLQKGVSPSHKELRPYTLILGLKIERTELEARIETRVEQMLASGFIDEVKTLRSKYSNSKALLAPGYKAFIKYLDEELLLDEAKAEFVRNDLHLAKRQMTWFKRNPDIHWIKNYSDADKYLINFL